MSHVNYGDRSGCVINIVSYPIVADSYPPSVATLQLLAIQQTRVLSKTIDSAPNSFKIGFG